MGSIITPVSATNSRVKAANSGVTRPKPHNDAQFQDDNHKFFVDIAVATD